MAGARNNLLLSATAYMTISMLKKCSTTTITALIVRFSLVRPQRERLFALHVDWAGRFKGLRQSRSGMFFTLPILLLSMRLCVNTLFSTLYPIWTRMPEGAQVRAGAVALHIACMSRLLRRPFCRCASVLYFGSSLCRDGDNPPAPAGCRRG